MSNKVYLEWEKVTQNWEDVHQLWEEVILIQEVARIVGGGGGIREYIKNNPWRKLIEQIGEEKTKKFIKIFAKVNGYNYESIIEYIDQVKVTVKEMQKVFEQTEKVGVKITFDK